MIALTSFLKALCDETRLRIMALLFQKELCVCEICDITGESQPKVSRHLANLRDANLVRDDRQGQRVFYNLNIDRKTASEIMYIIIKNIDEHAVLKQDMLTLNEKIEQAMMCEREAQSRNCP